MSVADKVSYLSRFLVKLVEVIGAGLATAAGGYLIAHLGGLWSSPAPAPAAPRAEMSRSLPATPVPANVIPNASVASKNPPVPPVAADADEQRVAPKQDANIPAADPTRKTVNASKPAPSSKRAKSDTADGKLQESKPAETKPQDAESVEARVRAALANVDANKPAPSDVSPPQPNVPRGPATVGAQPKPVTGLPAAAAVAAPPHAADSQPQPVPQAPLQPAPLTTVEIKSRPITDIEALLAPEQTPPAPEEKGVLAALKRIPEMLRREARPPAGEPPRPPAPVGGDQ